MGDALVSLGPFFSFEARLVRVVRSLLSVVMLVTNVALAPAREMALWTVDRPVSPVGLAPVARAATRAGLGALSPAASAVSGAAFLDRLRALPPSVGRLATAPLTGRPLVLLVEDIHKNEIAQRNIARVVDASMDGADVGAVALEAAFGPIDLSTLRAFPDTAALAEAARFTLERGEMTGPVYAALMRPGAPVPLVGADDSRAYRSQVEAVREAARVRPEIEARLSAAETSLRDAKNRRFAGALRDFDETATRYARGQIDLATYVAALESRGALTSPSAASFLKARALEASLDFSRLESERSAAIRRCVTRLPTADARAFTDQAIAYRARKMGATAFYAALQAALRRTGAGADDFPSLRRYAAYLDASERVDGDALLSDVAEAETATYDRLCASPEDRALVRRGRQLALTRKLVAFTMSGAEWRAYQSGRADGLNQPALLSPFERFYQASERRDFAMAASVAIALKTTGAGCAVLIAGGFHTPGLRRWLSAAGFDTATFVPSAPIAEGRDPAAYLNGFLERKVPLDRLFAGGRLFLGDDPVPARHAFVARELAVHAVRLARSGRWPDAPASYFQRLADAALPATRPAASVTVKESGVTVTLESEDGVAYTATAAFRPAGGADVTPRLERERSTLRPNPSLALWIAAGCLAAVAVIALVCVVGIPVEYGEGLRFRGHPLSGRVIAGAVVMFAFSTCAGVVRVVASGFGGDAESPELSARRLVRVQWFLDRLESGESAASLLREVREISAEDPLLTELQNALEASALQPLDVRGPIIRKLSQRLGDRFDFYPGGFASIDATPKNVSKRSALLHFADSHPAVRHLVYFGDEFYSREGKIGNDTPVLDAAQALATRGVDTVVFSVDAAPESRTETAREGTLWIGSGPAATRRVLSEIRSALFQGQTSVLITGRGPDSERSVTLDLSRWSEEGAIFFDVDGTLLPRKSDDLSNRPDMRDLLAWFLSAGHRLGILSGNSRTEQERRLIDPLRASAPVERFVIYANAGATCVTYDREGRRKVSNLTPPIAAGDIAALSAVVSGEAASDFGLSPAHRKSWLGWFSFNGRYGTRPDYPNVRFVPWTSGQPFTPDVVDAERVGTAGQRVRPLRLTEPFLEIREGVQISLKLFPRAAEPDAEDEWRRFYVAYDAARARHRRLYRALLKRRAIDPAEIQRAADPSWDQSDRAREIWGATDSSGAFVKSPFHVRMEKLLGLTDLVADQRTDGFQAEIRAKQALVGLWLRFQALGWDPDHVSQADFNREFGVQPLVLASGLASRFSQFTHKALATNGVGRTNAAFALQGSYGAVGVTPVVGVGEKVLGEVLKAENLSDYDAGTGLFTIRPEILEQLRRDPILLPDSPLLDRRRLHEIFERNVILFFDPSLAGHGNHLLESVQRLAEAGLLRTRYVQINFAEVAGSALPEHSNPMLITYLAMLAGNHLVVAGGRGAKGEVRSKGHFFRSDGALVAYSEWEQIPHATSLGAWDSVYRRFGASTERAEGEAAHLRQQRKQQLLSETAFRAAVAALRRANPYLSISDDGWVFSHETLAYVQSCCAAWKSLEPDLKNELRRQFAIIDRPDGTADLLISSNSGIFDTGLVLLAATDARAEYDLYGYGEYDRLSKSGLSPPSDNRLPTALWRTDVKDGHTTSSAWGLVEDASRWLPGDPDAVDLVYVGDNAASSIKDGAAQDRFSESYRRHRGGLPAVRTIALSVEAGEIVALVKAQMTTRAVNRLLEAALSFTNVYGALLNDLFVATRSGDWQPEVLKIVAQVHDLAVRASPWPRNEGPRGGLIQGLHIQAVARAIDEDLVSPAVYRAIATDSFFRREVLPLFGQLALHPKSGYLRRLIDRGMSPAIEARVDAQARNGRVQATWARSPRAIAFTGGTAAAFLPRVLRVAALDDQRGQTESLLFGVLSHVDDGGATFNILSCLWHAGYGILPPIGDQVSALFSSFASEDKMKHLLGNAGRVRDGNAQTAREFAMRGLVTTFFDPDIDVRPDFFRFAEDFLGALDEVDMQFILTGCLPLAGASLRNLYLLGRLSLADLLTRNDPRDDQNAIQDPYEYQRVLDDLADFTGITAGQVAPITFDPATIYTAHAEHTLFVESTASDKAAVPIRNGHHTVFVRAVGLGRFDEGDSLKFTTGLGKGKEESTVLKSGASVAVGNLTVSVTPEGAYLSSNEDRVRLTETPESLSVALVPDDGEPIHIARDGSGREMSRENVVEKGAYIPWIHLGAARFLLRSRYIVMQTHATETTNFSRVVDVGLVDKKVGLSAGPFGKHLTVQHEPQAAPNPIVLERLQDAGDGDTIIIGPGSVFTSLLPHFLVAGVPQQLADAKARGARIVLVMNGVYDNETRNLSVREILSFFEQKAGRPLSTFISGIIFASAPPNRPPESVISDYMNRVDTGYDPVIESWAYDADGEMRGGDARERLSRDAGLRDRVVSMYHALLGTIHGETHVELRTDPAAPSVSAKTSYGPLTPTRDEIDWLRAQGIALDVSPMLTLGSSVDRASGKGSPRAVHDPVLLGGALARLLRRSGQPAALPFPAAGERYPAPPSEYAKLSTHTFRDLREMRSFLVRIESEAAGEKSVLPDTHHVPGTTADLPYEYVVPHVRPVLRTFDEATRLVPLVLWSWSSRAGADPGTVVDLGKILTQYLVGAVSNSIDAGATDIRIRVGHTARSLEITVLDNGGGFSPAVVRDFLRRHVFQSTKYGRNDVWGGQGMFLTDLFSKAALFGWTAQLANQEEASGHLDARITLSIPTVPHLTRTDLMGWSARVREAMREGPTVSLAALLGTIPDRAAAEPLRSAISDLMAERTASAVDAVARIVLEYNLNAPEQEAISLLFPNNPNPLRAYELLTENPAWNQWKGADEVRVHFAGRLGDARPAAFQPNSLPYLWRLLSGRPLSAGAARAWLVAGAAAEALLWSGASLVLAASGVPLAKLAALLAVIIYAWLHVDAETRLATAEGRIVSVGHWLASFALRSALFGLYPSLAWIEAPAAAFAVLGAFQIGSDVLLADPAARTRLARVGTSAATSALENLIVPYAEEMVFAAIALAADQPWILLASRALHIGLHARKGTDRDGRTLSVGQRLAIPAAVSALGLLIAPSVFGAAPLYIPGVTMAMPGVGSLADWLGTAAAARIGRFMIVHALANTATPLIVLLTGLPLGKAVLAFGDRTRPRPIVPPADVDRILGDIETLLNRATRGEPQQADWREIYGQLTARIHELHPDVDLTFDPVDGSADIVMRVDGRLYDRYRFEPVPDRGGAELRVLHRYGHTSIAAPSLEFAAMFINHLKFVSNRLTARADAASDTLVLSTVFSDAGGPPRTLEAGVRVDDERAMLAAMAAAYALVGVERLRRRTAAIEPDDSGAELSLIERFFAAFRLDGHKRAGAIGYAEMIAAHDPEVRRYLDHAIPENRVPSDFIKILLRVTPPSGQWRVIVNALENTARSVTDDEVRLVFEWVAMKTMTDHVPVVSARLVRALRRLAVWEGAEWHVPDNFSQLLVEIFNLILPTVHGRLPVRLEARLALRRALRRMASSPDVPAPVRELAAKEARRIRVSSRPARIAGARAEALFQRVVTAGLPRRIRILYLEDDADSREAMLRYGLTPDAFDVTVAENGVQGLERLRDGGPFDVVLSDVQMPEMDGLTFLREAQAVDPDIESKIIIHTGYNPESLHKKGVPESVPVIPKPDLYQLIPAVASIASRSLGTTVLTEPIPPYRYRSESAVSVLPPQAPGLGGKSGSSAFQPNSLPYLWRLLTGRPLSARAARAWLGGGAAAEALSWSGASLALTASGAPLAKLAALSAVIVYAWLHVDAETRLATAEGRIVSVGHLLASFALRSALFGLYPSLAWIEAPAAAFALLGAFQIGSNVLLAGRTLGASAARAGARGAFLNRHVGWIDGRGRLGYDPAAMDDASLDAALRDAVHERAASETSADSAVTDDIGVAADVSDGDLIVPVGAAAGDTESALDTVRAALRHLPEGARLFIACDGKTAARLAAFLPDAPVRFWTAPIPVVLGRHLDVVALETALDKGEAAQVKGARLFLPATLTFDASRIRPFWRLASVRLATPIGDQLFLWAPDVRFDTMLSRWRRTQSAA